MPLDPQAAAYLERMKRLGVPPVNEVPLAHARASYSSSASELFGNPDPVESVETVVADGVPVRIYHPRDARPDHAAAALATSTGTAPTSGAAPGSPPALVYAHGGGWVIGDLDSHGPVCQQLAARSGVTVVSVDYRLAPEHPYPAAIEDVWTATRWAAARFAPLAVAGDSAGGQLAASVALRARDAGIALALQVLIYPATDRGSAPTPVEIEDGPLPPEVMVWFWEQYAPDPDRAQEPDLSPMRAASLRGVAPALVITAEFDPLMAQGEAYAHRLEADGVPVRLRRFDGLAHGFIRMPAVIDRAAEAIDLMADSVRSATTG